MESANLISTICRLRNDFTSHGITAGKMNKLRSSGGLKRRAPCRCKKVYVCVIWGRRGDVVEDLEITEREKSLNLLLKQKVSHGASSLMTEELVTGGVDFFCAFGTLAERSPYHSSILLTICVLVPGTQLNPPTVHLRPAK